ncbi:hypothetical protein GYMLUDRAFT_228484 [Collybiopsis luxurians FD-317 M1]|uniref:Aspergillopepsin n=1 Tax=Collybiopsis luxurians FD-317 M1 TaxID=944289 RepID=A0A0D0BRR1_9AGAR|nr:hypothetical protein GYMLUDRAFT_228484 [Collybiopsis luxurians FD-317 M1]
MRFSTSQVISAILLWSGSALGGPSRLSEREAARRGRQTTPIIRLSENSGLIQGADATTPGSSVDHNSTFSANWAGAVLTSAPSGQRYATAVGTFIIPDPKSSSSQSSSASAWVGIDGDTANAAILQAGIDFTVSESGDVTYDAWNEFFPTPAEDFTGFPMAAGDSITVTIEATSPTSGTVTLDNNTQQKSVSKTLQSPSSTAALQGLNAEWIVEDFEENGEMVPLTSWGTVTFTGASAGTNAGSSVGPSTGNIINMEQNGKVLTDVRTSGSTVTIPRIA